MSETKLFYMRHSASSGKGWLYAVHIQSRSPLVSNYCSRCGSGSEIPSGAFDVDLEGGWKFPDILQCGAYPFLIVSDRVVSVWRESGVDCFDAYEVQVRSVDSEKTVVGSPPSYFRVEITGTCTVDVKESNISITSKCRTCGRGMIMRDFEKPFSLVAGSWNDFALFRDHDLLPGVSFCTQAVFQLAAEHKHTNFRFEPVQISKG